MLWVLVYVLHGLRVMPALVLNALKRPDVMLFVSIPVGVVTVLSTAGLTGWAGHRMVCLGLGRREPKVPAALRLSYNKIASAMIGHRELLETVAEEQKVTFISTAMSTYEAIDQAVDIFRARGCPLVLMHCVGEYPAPEATLNFRLIEELRRRYQCPVGYSGHEPTMIPGVLAAMMGAVAVERHITLDRAMYGSDQAASLEKRGLELMVAYIRSIPTVLGDGVKRITTAEEANARKLRYYLEPSAESSLATAGKLL